DVKIPYTKIGDDVSFDIDGICRVKSVFEDWNSHDNKFFNDEDDEDDVEEDDQDEEKDNEDEDEDESDIDMENKRAYSRLIIKEMSSVLSDTENKYKNEISKLESKLEETTKELE